MNEKEFKRALAGVLTEAGFVIDSNVARIETEELIVVIATQKSNYENKYYINFGVLLKELNPGETKPKDNQCDIFGRLNLEIDGEAKHSFDYEFVRTEDFIPSLKKELNKTIKPILDYGVKKYFEIYPQAMMTATQKLKNYLNS